MDGSRWEEARQDVNEWKTENEVGRSEMGKTRKRLWVLGVGGSDRGRRRMREDVESPREGEVKIGWGGCGW